MKTQIVNDYIKMISSYSSLIISEADKSWKNINFSQNEPEIVKDYLLSPNIGIDYLNWNLSEVIYRQTNRYEIKFASVFCHQKPRIKRTPNSVSSCIGDTISCELGDLMTIFVLLDKNKKIVYSSAKIMQAKKTHNIDSQSQKCLYENDIEFEMPKNIIEYSSNDNNLRFFPDFDDNREKALSYLILNNGIPLVKQIPSSSNLSYRWGYHLQLTLEMKSGLSFTTPIDKNDSGWNCIINDLINVGTGKVKNNIKRGYGLNHFINHFNYFFFYPEYIMENENFGIPKIIIFCKDTELALE
ncbi:MAG: hypothetical protein DI529_06630 [Chryseobacterium sp.]|nr:MAG: hypothetical protein DI529_06630 [Chryseobacterium sp.]